MNKKDDFPARRTGGSARSPRQVYLAWLQMRTHPPAGPHYLSEVVKEHNDVHAVRKNKQPGQSKEE